MPADAEVHDDAAGGRFVLAADDSPAELVYRREPGRLVLVHTGVPDSLGGRGIGGRLVRAALDQAKSERLTIVPWCPFARQWLGSHPDAVDGIDIDWASTPRRGEGTDG